MGKVPSFVVIIACMLSVIFLMISLVLLSSIIAWLSLEFSGPIPHALGFILGIFSLADAVLAVFMIGIARIRRTLAFVFMASSAITLLASLSLFIPWLVEYLNFCDACLEEELTNSCVSMCQDECCFTDMSRPLALVFVIFSALVLLLSLVGVVVAIPYVRYSVDTSSSIKKR